VQIDVLNFLEQTKAYMRQPQSDWSQLARLQRDLIHWLEGERRG